MSTSVEEARNHAQWELAWVVMRQDSPYGNENIVAYEVVSAITAGLAPELIPGKKAIAVATMERLDLLLQGAGLRFEVGKSWAKRQEHKTLVQKVLEDLTDPDPEILNGVRSGLQRVLEDL